MVLNKKSLTNSILISVVLGILAGLFFGEWCTRLDLIGKAFLAIMQISVLPYILVSLIQNIGSLEVSQAKLLGKRGLVMIIGLWIIVFLLLTLMSFSFPDWKMPSFFSHRLLENPEPVDYIYLFIPSNPFHSLANNLIPAVTVFSILTGLILMQVPQKQKLLEQLEIASQTLTRLNLTLVKLAPIGIFALVADATGEMRIDETGHVAIYLITYLVMGLLLFFLVLPMLLSIFTPFSYREIMRYSRTSMLTVFLTGSPFIILPMLVENIRELFQSRNLDSEKSEQMVKIIVPIIFVLPCAGQLMDLLFLLFASWFNYEPIGFFGFVKLYSVGLLTAFGRAAVAVPTLLDLLRLPADMDELFTLSSVATDSIKHTVEAFTIFSCTAFLTAWLTGTLRFSWKDAGGKLLFTGGVAASVLLALTLLFRFSSAPQKERHILDLMTLTPAVEFQVFNRLPQTTAPREEGALNRIHRTKVLRIGFNADTMPFIFFGPQGDLIGFDIALANMLASELNCRKIEFYPISPRDLASPLNGNQVDLIMGELSITEERLSKVSFTDHYLELSMALLVPDYLKSRLRNDPSLLRRLKIAAPEGANYNRLEKVYPEMEKVKLDSFDDFFSGECDADVLLTSAEDGAIRTILYPEYDIYIPARQQKDLIAFAVPYGDIRFVEYLNFWLTLKRVNGDIDREYDYWIRGINVEPRKPRWSILNNLILGNAE